MSPTSRTVLLGKPDAYLVERARRGCDVAFAEIVARYRPSLLRHCSRYLPRPRAEDAVQQTFIRAMQWLRSGAQVRELRPWLYAIARNVALNELAKNGWDYDELPEGWEDRAGGDDVERRATWRETLGAVAALPDRQRRALLRSVVDGHSPAAIAVELGVSEGAVRQLVHRARVSVRAAVGAVLPTPLLWLARKLGAGAARVAPTSPAAAPLAPKLAVVVVAAISTGVPLAAVVHHASPHPPRVIRAAFHRAASSTVHLGSRTATAAAVGASKPAEPPRTASNWPPSFVAAAPPPAPAPQPSNPTPPSAPSTPIATAAAADQSTGPDQTASANPSCDPNTDPSCAGTTGANTGCDPSADPSCGGSTGGSSGGTTGGNTGCDPSTDPSCGGSTGGTTGGNTGCDPSTDPSCSGSSGGSTGGNTGGNAGGSTGCDPTTDPTCGGSPSAASANAGSSSVPTAGGSPSPASTQAASSDSSPPTAAAQAVPSGG